jgi:hypothetical protein
MFGIHGMAMFQGVEPSNGTYCKLNNGKKKKEPRKNVNVKQNLNACIGHRSLTLNDVETPMMEIFKWAYVFET